MARTKIQREVESMLGDLRPLSEKEEQWAWNRVFDHTAYRSAGKAWCVDCGSVFNVESPLLGTILLGEDTICPKCGRKVKIVASRRQKEESRAYFTVLDTLKGWQVVRHFLAERYSRKGQKPWRHIAEVAAIWVNPSGRRVVTGLGIVPFQYYLDRWSFSTRFQCRADAPRFDIRAEIAPGGKVLPVLRRNGYNRRINIYPVDRLFEAILRYNGAETLLKQGEVELLKHIYFATHPGIYDGLKRSINIAKRHGYRIKDASLWCDYIHLLQHFGMDDRNPRLICPEDLRAVHDRLLRKKTIEDRRILEEERLRRNIERVEDYAKKVQPYIGICIEGEGVFVRVIPTLQELKEEGEKMNHCVYEMGYDRRDCLILSARDCETGKRLATIELSTTSWTIVQCRSKNNGTPKLDKEIRSVIRKNIKEITSRAKPACA